MDLRAKLLGENSEEYIMSVNNYAVQYSSIENYDEAIRWQTKAVTLCEKLSVRPKNYGMVVMNLGRYYFILDKQREASVNFEKALPYYDTNIPIYEKLLTWLGFCYTDLGDDVNLARIMELTKKHNEKELEKECNEPICLIEQAEYYANSGENAKAKECYLKALAMKMTDKEKAQVYESYARFLGANKDYSAGTEYYDMAAKAQKNIEGGSERYINMIYSTALYAFIGKKYEEAISHHQEVIAYYAGNRSEKAREKTALCHKGIGNAYKALKDYKTAKKAYQQVINYYKSNNPKSEEYPKAIANIAFCEKFNKEYDASIAHYKEAIAIYEQMGMPDKVEETTNSLTLCYAYAGKPIEQDNAVEQAGKAAQKEKLKTIITAELAKLDITRTYLGQLTYANSLATIAGCYYLSEDYVNAASYYKQYIAVIRDAVRYEFRLQNEQERMNMWNEQVKNINELFDMLTTIAGNKRLVADLSATAYDAILLSKGILLNSAIEFESVLQESGDAKLQEMYRKTKRNEETIATLRKTISSNADKEKVLALTRENQSLQLQLYKGCAEYADFTDYIGYTWQDIKQTLQTGDVAVEFKSVTTSPFDDYNWLIAFILTSTSETPTIVPINTLGAVKSLAQSDSLYADPKAGAIVWGMLAHYLNGAKRLFFSADDIFNNIGIEYLTVGDRPLSEQIEAYRLSSTKELCRHYEQTKREKMAIFGDINYNSLSSSTVGKTESVENESGEQRGAVQKYPRLKYAAREIQEISTMAKPKFKTIELRRDTDASEFAFRKLSGAGVNILHIVTHGKYDNKGKITNEEAMTHSTLAFANANFSKDKTADNDGILTASDVARMNFRQCELTVLSACETGLGKLGEDGVFGLQRGFKNAGVHSLLMSITPVYDNATTELMINFFRHLFNGNTKREALIKAQQELRDKGYTGGQYWATFILLDALN